MSADADVDRELLLAQSDASEERDDAVSWLLGHPDRAEPVVRAAVLDGTAPHPELFLRLLAAMGSLASIPAMEASLLRGNEGESFHAAQALAAHPSPAAHAALRRHLDRLSPVVRAGLEQAGFA